MSGQSETGEARTTAIEVDGVLEVALAGVWQVTAPRPSWKKLLGDRRPDRIRLRIDAVEKWDTSMLLFLFEVREWSRSASAYCDTAALPEKVSALLAQLAAARETSVPFDRSETFLSGVGRATIETWARARTASTFLGVSV